MKVYHLFSSFVWKNVTRRMIVFGLIALASGFFARAELTGNWVTLTNDTINAVGVINGWNASYWDDGRDPHVDADYLVNAKTIHSPKWGNNSGCKAPTNCVFGGNSLWLTNGATLAICTVDTTFSDSALIRMTLPLEGLNIASGGKNVISMYDYGEANVFGLLEVQPGATLSLEASAHAMPKSKVLIREF